VTKSVDLFARALVQAGLRRTTAFARPSLLAEALTHSSWAEAHGGAHNERLEMLGDAVVGVLVAEALFERHPSAPEGVLTRMRAALVEERSLARHARLLGLGSLVAMSPGEERTGGRERDALLADALEAVVAALHLSEGLDEARDVVRLLFAEALDTVSPDSIRTSDAKTVLQERVQAACRRTPEYRHVETQGPAHAPSFAFEAVVEGVVEGRGEGRTKKAAQQAAAEAALARWEAIAARLSGSVKA
jgi:ribonuclease-3